MAEVWEDRTKRQPFCTSALSNAPATGRLPVRMATHFAVWGDVQDDRFSNCFE